MKNIAYVKEISGENAVLKIKRECACGGKERCGAKCFTLADEMLEAVIYNNIGAKAGDYVEVEGKTSAVLIYASAVFILPVFTGLVLYFIADLLINNIVVPYIASGTGFILSIACLYYFFNKIAKKRTSSDFKITKILSIIGENNGL
jgi:sigma-E factor negative regulatory protein RseC